MSEAGAIASARPDFAEAQAKWALRPVWLRPAAIVLALALHAAAAAFVAVPSLPASPNDAIDVTLVAQGDAAEEKQARDEVKPAEAPAPPPPPPAEAAPELAAPAPLIEAPQAAALSVAKPEPEPVATPEPRLIVEQQVDPPTPAAFVAAPSLPASPTDAIDATLGPQGDAAEAKQALDEVKPAEAPAPPPPSPAEAAPELAAPAPRIEAPQAVPLAVAKPEPKPVATPKPRLVVEQQVDRPTPATSREQRRQQREAAERRRKAEAAELADRLGAEQARAEATAASRASYASLLSAELNRHKIYPSSARAAGVTGSVGVAFTVGASGDVIEHAITRSSGSPDLDGAVEAMMAAVRAPPPPGGIFRTSTTVNFSLR